MRYYHLVIAVIIAAILGFTSFIFYGQQATTPDNRLGLVVLAVAAGTASFFSPCSFGLMTGLLAREAGARDGRTRPDILRRGLRFAGALAVGAGLFFLLAGIGLAFGAKTLFGSITFSSLGGRVLRGVVGIVLITLGLMQLELLPNLLSQVSNVVAPLLRYQARTRRQTPTLGFMILGFAYPLAGFG